MKKFRFTLDAVRVVRQREEKEALESYSSALLARQKALDRLEEVRLQQAEAAEQTRQERRNLLAIYHIKDIPGDSQMRATLDLVEPERLRALFATLFEALFTAGVVKEYHYWQGQVIVAVDGVQHFASAQIHCDHCTTRTHRNGTLSYHAGLAAVMLHPDHAEVFPLDFEPILNQDGDKKNDCERNAAKRLCQALSERSPGLAILLVEDALYANAPHLRQIAGYGWSYVLNGTPDSHKSLFQQFAGRRQSGQVKELRHTDAAGAQHDYAWTSGLCLCASATDGCMIRTT